MNPEASLSDVLMDKDLTKVSAADLRWLAQKFLKEAHEKSFDPQKPQFYKKWFAIDPQYKLRRDLPQRCGYLLGWRVVQYLAKWHSLQEMIHWKVPQIHKNVQNALKDLSSLEAK